MRESELRKAVACAHCGKKIGETGMPMFYRVKLERHLLNLPAIQRQDGLTALLGGNARLAQVMGTDEEMTLDTLEGCPQITICESCSTKNLCVAQLAEYVNHSQI